MRVWQGKGEATGKTSHVQHQNPCNPARQKTNATRTDLPRASGGGGDDGQNFDRFLDFSEDGANFESQFRCLCRKEKHFSKLQRCATKRVAAHVHASGTIAIKRIATGYRRKTFLAPRTPVHRTYNCHTQNNNSLPLVLPYLVAVSALVGLSLFGPGDLQDGVKGGQCQAI